MDRTDKIVTLIDECLSLGLNVQMPDVNASGYTFIASGDSTIRYGLGAVKGVGQSAVEAIVAERERHGPFTSLEDLCQRSDLQRVNKRVLEALIRSGSCDGLGVGRAGLMAALESAMRAGEQVARSSEAGQVDIFGIASRPRRRARAARPRALQLRGCRSGASTSAWPVSGRHSGCI